MTSSPLSYKDERDEKANVLAFPIIPSMVSRSEAVDMCKQMSDWALRSKVVSDLVKALEIACDQMRFTDSLDITNSKVSEV